MNRRALFALAAPRAAAAPVARLTTPLRIRSVAPIVVRAPADAKTPEEIVSMTPRGAMTGGVGLWNCVSR
jgi:hypothetical protein